MLLLKWNPIIWFMPYLYVDFDHLSRIHIYIHIYTHIYLYTVWDKALLWTSGYSGIHYVTTLVLNLWWSSFLRFSNAVTTGVGHSVTLLFLCGVVLGVRRKPTNAYIASAFLKLRHRHLLSPGAIVFGCENGIRQAPWKERQPIPGYLPTGPTGLVLSFKGASRSALRRAPGMSKRTRCGCQLWVQPEYWCYWLIVEILEMNQYSSWILW